MLVKKNFSKIVLYCLIFYCFHLFNIYSNTNIQYEVYSNRLCEAYKWQKDVNNPIIGNEKSGDLFDPFVIIDSDENYRMYISTRKNNSISLSIGQKDNEKIIWSDLYISLEADEKREWDKVVNRASVIYRNGLYQMWYTGQNNNKSSIGYAVSKDGIHFKRYSENPILTYEYAYEGTNVMNPHVIYDIESKIYKMYYAAGEYIEPNVICYATSRDGVHWKKYSKNPILKASHEENTLDSYKVGGPYVLNYKKKYILFYIGYTDLHTGRILLAVSQNGVNNWIRYNKNPIVESTQNSFDSDSVYKPSVMYDHKNKRWILWYNGRSGEREYIGMSILNSQELIY